MKCMFTKRVGFGALTIALTALLALGGCAKAPEVDAGEDQEVVTGELVGLEGSVNLHQDDPITIGWRIVQAPAGSLAELTAADTLTPWFVADTEGDYVLELEVEQDERIGKADVTVTAAGEHIEMAMLPTADAGEDQSVETNEIAQLVGDVTDPSENGFTVAWHFVSVPEGSKAELSAATSLTPWFLADRAGEYLIELTATNEVGAARDRVRVQADGDPTTFTRNPVADAGDDMMAPAPGMFWNQTTVQLDGTGSFHPEGGPFWLEWVILSAPEGSNTWLDGNQQMTPTLRIDKEGEYEIAAYPCDFEICGRPDTVMVTAEGAHELELVAGNDQEAPVTRRTEQPMVFRAVNSAGQAIPGVPVGPMMVSGPYDEDHPWDDDILFEDDHTNENGLAFASIRFNDVAGPRDILLGALLDTTELGEWDFENWSIAEIEFSATAIAEGIAGIRFDHEDLEEASVLEPFMLTAFVHDQYGNIVSWEDEMEVTLIGHSPATFAEEAETGTVIDGGGTTEVVLQVSGGLAEIELATELSGEIMIDGLIGLEIEGFPGPMQARWDDVTVDFNPGPPVELAFLRLLEGAGGGNAHKDSKRGGNIDVLVVMRDELGNAAYPDGPDKPRFWIHAEGDGEDTPELIDRTGERGIVVGGGGGLPSIFMEGTFFSKRGQWYFGAEVRMTNENAELVTLSLEDESVGLDDSATTARRFTGDPVSFVALNDGPLAGVAGQDLPETVGVRVEDEDGLPIPGLWVEWSVEEGGGEVEGHPGWGRWSNTNQNGEAFVNWWRLGPDAGDDNNMLEAELSTGCDFELDPVEFVASAEPSVPARLVLLPIDQPEAGDETVELEIELQDAFGHLVEDSDPVRFTLEETWDRARFTAAVEGSIIEGEGARIVYVETEYGRVVVELTTDTFSQTRFTARDTDNTGLSFEGFGGTQPLYQADFQGNDGGMTPDTPFDGRSSSWEWGTPTYGPSGVTGKFNSRAWGTHLGGYAYANEGSCLTTPWFYLPESGSSLRTRFDIWAETQNQMEWWSMFCNEDGVCRDVTNRTWDDTPYWNSHNRLMAAHNYNALAGSHVQFMVCTLAHFNPFWDDPPAGIYQSSLDISIWTGSDPSVNFAPAPEDP